ncbi:MAG: CTP synthase (glutamine hydrolyzing) [Candidatus Heimdallarchaeota archaeon]|nr:CTP synthase (glutamine hydrolyzing) [Candidatus Heimdallarchaeota archaeon]MBY8995956.1 CTP synthase (glutamine hydrolyzing) [Candidatus Heimdallarchaeota archaeon]
MAKKTKFVFIVGGVMSGIGKGVVTSSIGKNIQARKGTIDLIKIDPYLNIDAGTMNPIQHGEVFVTDDGGEIDVDFGHYARILGLNMKKSQNITTGKVYREVIRKERAGDYLGQTVQVIPHITDEIKKRIREVVELRNPDVLLIEVGGTVGDMESQPFLEAIRQMIMEEKREDTLLVHTTFVPVPVHLGEPKTKPTQHSVKELRSIGLNPKIIVCRSHDVLDEQILEKVALFCNVPKEAVFTLPDLDTVYSAPYLLDQQGFGELIIEELKLDVEKVEWKEWNELTERFENPKDCVKIAMGGKYTTIVDSYISVNEALKHAAAFFKFGVEIDWIDTEEIEQDKNKVKIMDEYDGLLVPGGFGYRGTEGKITMICHARENNIPFLGLCFGFQLATVEFSRNVLGVKDASSFEFTMNGDVKSKNLVIDLLPEQKRVTDLGGTMRLGGLKVLIKKGTNTHRLYKKDLIVERHRHRFEVNPDFIERIEKKGLVFAGTSEDGRRMEIFELPGHRFFQASQFHPEFTSLPWNPNPLFRGFIEAAIDRQKERLKT